MKIYVSYGGNKRSRFAESRDKVEERLASLEVEIVKNARDADLIVIPDNGEPGKLHVPYETLSVFLANRADKRPIGPLIENGPDYARIENALHEIHEERAEAKETHKSTRMMEPQEPIVDQMEFETAWRILASDFHAFINLTTHVSLHYISDFIVYILSILHALEANCKIILVYFSERLYLPRTPLPDILHFTSLAEALVQWQTPLPTEPLLDLLQLLRARQAALAWLEAWFRNMYAEWARLFRAEFSTDNLLPKLTDMVKAFCDSVSLTNEVAFIHKNLMEIYHVWFDPNEIRESSCDDIVFLVRTIEMRLAKTMGRLVIWKYAQPIPIDVSAKLFAGEPKERDEALEWLRRSFDPQYDETFLRLLVFLRNAMKILSQ